MKKTIINLTAVLAVTVSVQAAETTRFPVEGHVQDPSVVQAEDGTYYLTGMSNINTPNPQHADFQNNDGIRLWQSKDLKNWEDLGLIWNLATDPGNYLKSIHVTEGWVRYMRPDIESDDKTLHHGVTDVRLHHIKGKYYLTFSMNHYGICILESVKDDPKGSYKQPNKDTNATSKYSFPTSYCAAKGSLFQDEDGSIYMVWGHGLIAKMKGDLSGLEETPWDLRQHFAGYPGHVEGPDTFGEDDAFLFKRDGRYYLLYSAWVKDGDRGTRALLVTSAPALNGPFVTPEILVRGVTAATVFTDAKNQAFLVRSRDGHPVLDAITFTNDKLHINLSK